MLEIRNFKNLLQRGNQISKSNVHLILGGIDKCTGGGMKRKSDGSFTSWTADCTINVGEANEHTTYYGQLNP